MEFCRKRREIGLGAYAGVGLALAMEKAPQIRVAIFAGVDPVTQRQVNRESIKQAQLKEKLSLDLRSVHPHLVDP